MSEQDKIELSDRITEGIRKAQRKLYERKAKLGENIVIADENGAPSSSRSPTTSSDTPNRNPRKICIRD